MADYVKRRSGQAFSLLDGISIENGHHQSAMSEGMVREEREAYREMEGVMISEGRVISDEGWEAADLISRMERGADRAKELKLSRENWQKEFWEAGIVQTPVGYV